MWVLKIWLVYVIVANGPGIPKQFPIQQQTIGYFTSNDKCQIHGWEMTKNDQFLVWSCEPE